MDLFERDLVRFERGARRLSPNLDGRQGAFDAVVSFCFNAGLGNYQSSGIRMKNNRGDFDGAAQEFLKWVRGGGKILPGLVKRRKDEMSLYLST
jgi:lysozyme